MAGDEMAVGERGEGVRVRAGVSGCGLPVVRIVGLRSAARERRKVAG